MKSESVSASPQTSERKEDVGLETPTALGEQDASRQALLEAACQLVLLFHSASPWDEVKRKKWDEGMNLCLGAPETRDVRKVGSYGDGTWDGANPTNEATTKNLCNAIRAALSL